MQRRSGPVLQLDEDRIRELLRRSDVGIGRAGISQPLASFVHLLEYLPSPPGGSVTSVTAAGNRGVDT